MALDRLKAIGAAAGNEPAAGTQQGREPAAVASDQGDQGKLQRLAEACDANG